MEEPLTVLGSNIGEALVLFQFADICEIELVTALKNAVLFFAETKI